MRFLILRVLPLLAVLYTLLCVGVYFGQRRLLYFPGGSPDHDPANEGFEHDNVVISTGDGEELHGWLIQPSAPLSPSGQRAAVLVSHGNAGNISGRLHLARAFTDLGLHVLLYDYRGYGDSSGSPTEAGLYADIRAAHEHLIVKRGFRRQRIFLYGESLGGGPTVDLASLEPCAGVLLDKTFTSAVDVAREVYGWLPVDLLMRDRFESLEKITSVNSPVLVLHSDGDELIPSSHGRALFAAANEPKQYVETRGGHNDIGFPADEAALQQIAEFIESALAPKEAR